MAKGKANQSTKVTKAANAKNSVKFNYQKSGQFETHHSDGAYGGLTPRGLLNIMFYLERNPLPRNVEYELIGESQIGKELRRESKDGILREVTTGIILDINAATSLRDWLNIKLEEYAKLFGNKKKENAD